MPTYLGFCAKCWNFKPFVLHVYLSIFAWSLYNICSMSICFHVHNFVFKVEIPKHELEHNEAAIEEEDRTQFEVDMVMFNNFCLIFGVPWH